MAPKAKKEEPPAKKAKTEEPKKEEPKKEEEEVKKEEETKFEEPDAPKDSRSALKETVTFPTTQTTLNVVPTLGGKMLTSVTDNGMGYLLAGARANVGVKSGRYMFEVKMIQGLPNWRDKKSGPMLRVGFSTAGSSLFLGEDVNGVGYSCFGEYIAERKLVNLPHKAQFAKEATIAIVLNLDAKSPNANTVNLYLDGEKVGDPKPLPEDMKGVALFPTVTFRNLTIRVNFGPAAIKELPFKCRLLGGAANSDVTVLPSTEPKDGKYEVVFPVAFPDEGTFMWADAFLEKNPSFVELSDRKIADWAKSSGLWGKTVYKWHSNDKPSISYGLPGLDDFSVRQVIKSLAPCLPRNYLIMEVKDNLLETGRSELLRKFSYPCFKKVAHVVMGKPDKEFKSLVQSKILKDKQAKSDAAWKKKKEEETKKKAVEKRKKEVEKARKAKEEEKKKKEEEKKDEEMKDSTEAKADEAEEEAKEEEEEPPVVELTEEEKKIDFLKSNTPDLTPSVLLSSFGKFTTPKAAEGFNEIRYEWEKGAKADAYLEDWVKNKKLTTRVEDLKPGQFFQDKLAEFEKAYADWQTKFKTAKKPAKKAEGEDEGEPGDVFAVADVNDMGDGVPLYSEFSFEDWELTKLRFELALMLTSFKKDCDDPDRTGIPLEHIFFYYGKYFKKGLALKSYGVTTEAELYALIKDTVQTKDIVLISGLKGDVENVDFCLKLAEQCRRERQRRIDAGDETARLKFRTTDAAAGKADEGKAAGNKMTPAPKVGDGKGKSKGKK